MAIFGNDNDNDKNNDNDNDSDNDIDSDKTTLMPMTRIMTNNDKLFVKPVPTPNYLKIFPVKSFSPFLGY